MTTSLTTTPSLQELEAALTPDTSIVSIMTVNNEIGVRQPVEQIGTTFQCVCVCVIFQKKNLPQVSFADRERCSSTLMLHR